MTKNQLKNLDLALDILLMERTDQYDVVQEIDWEDRILRKIALEKLSRESRRLLSLLEDEESICMFLGKNKVSFTGFKKYVCDKFGWKHRMVLKCRDEIRGVLA